MKRLLLVSMVVTLVLGVSFVYANSSSKPLFTLNYNEEGNTTSVTVFNAVGGATVSQWNWGCSEQNLLVSQTSGNAAVLASNAATSQGGEGSSATASDGGKGDDNLNPNVGNAGDADASGSSTASTGNFATASQTSNQTGNNWSDASIVNEVITKVKRTNRIKIKDSFND